MTPCMPLQAPLWQSCRPRGHHDLVRPLTLLYIPVEAARCLPPGGAGLTRCIMALCRGLQEAFGAVVCLFYWPFEGELRHSCYTPGLVVIAVSL
jgi:hypothetical protein